MNIVLLSGGSGKRLWPLSNDSRSKQFLKVLKDDNGNKESMLQRVWRQVNETISSNNALITTSASQIDMIKSQLGQTVPFIAEPSRRDTFPAIALSIVYLYSELKLDFDETVAVLPVDSYVEDGFFSVVQKMEETTTKANVDISLVGVTPSFPSTSYGYIVPEQDQLPGSLYVKSFVEKPDEKRAQELIEQNALWNCGFFSFKIGFLIDLLIEKGFSTDYYELLNSYDGLPKTSFDYEVLEKTNRIKVLPYNGYWSDLGSWSTLTETIEEKVTGKGIISEGTVDTHIINELDIPIKLIGIDDVIVAASPDGILVADKTSSAKVKDYSDDFGGRPMYEEYLWGWYRVLEYTKFNAGNEVLVKRIGVFPGQNMSYQLHLKRSENWTVIKGEGFLVINDKLKHIRTGDVINIPIATKHALKAASEMEIIEVQTGSELVEEDKRLITDKWEEIMENV